MTTVYIGVGSNLGNRKDNIDKALLSLKNTGRIVMRKISSIYETDPVGGSPQEKYLNGVVEIETDFLPFELLKCLKHIESMLGRIPGKKNTPRPIDLDILLYGNLKMETDTLSIPHPRMREREFVLRGLREVREERVCERNSRY